MNSRIVVGIIAMFAFATAGLAAPNFSGTWKLNNGKSNYGPVSAPERMERKIAHEDPSLKMTIIQMGDEGERTLDLAYKTDGSESVNRIHDVDVKSVAKWDGNVLVVSSKRGDFSQSERWTLSEDGKVLTLVNRINSPEGDFEVTVVMDKQ